MKKILFFLFLPVFAFAQKNTSVQVLEQTKDYTVVKILVGDVSFTEVNTPNGIEKIPSIHKATSLLKKGAPDLPKIAFSLITPNNKNGRVEELSSSFTEIENINIAPSKGRVSSQFSKSLITYTYGNEYGMDEMFPNKIGEINAPYILRDFRGQATHVYPLQYNPVQKKLKVYREITLKIHFDQNTQENILAREEVCPAAIDQTYHEIYKYQFLNYKTLSAPYTPLPQHGKMLILCPGKYASAMTDFIDWKTRKGYQIFFENTDTISGGVTEASIEALVTQYYNQEQITYLLIVGDNPDIPARNAYYTVPTLFGPSDAAYAYQTGSDHYPEFIVGRFSADTLMDVVTQVNKVLAYEKTPNTSSSWMQAQIAMGSNQGPGDKGEFDHVHLRGIADSNKNFYSYNFTYELFDGSQGGLDAPNNPSTNLFTNAINSKVGLINYCGHGSSDIFTTSLFSGVNNTADLTNTGGEWPVIFSTACLNGNFIYTTCLGESLLRARDANDNPKGAIAAIMCSIFQAWDPPMQGQDEMNAILRGARPGTYQTTFGAITFSGGMSTLDSYNTNIDPHGGDEIMDTWIVFADPSLEIYTEDKGSLTCTHSATIGQGSVSYAVNCSEDNALIGLYYQGEFLSSAIAQGGVANFTFPAVNNLDSIFITATKQNFVPYSGYVEVVTGQAFGIDDLLKENIQLYPNPSADMLYIKDPENKVTKLNVLDMHGRIIKISNSSQVNVSSLASGTYQLKLFLKDKVLTTPFNKK